MWPDAFRVRLVTHRDWKDDMRGLEEDRERVISAVNPAEAGCTSWRGSGTLPE
jgi:hypothetical protein